MMLVEIHFAFISEFTLRLSKEINFFRLVCIFLDFLSGLNYYMVTN